jgi:alkylation response protein AidB-like acyl-CoA dehydrogenase
MATAAGATLGHAMSHESIGDAQWFIRTASKYASERIVFDRPIGQNQGVQFPIARAYAEMQGAEMMLRKAAARTVEQLWKAIAHAIDAFTPNECANYFAAAGYDAD